MKSRKQLLKEAESELKQIRSGLKEYSEDSPLGDVLKDFSEKLNDLANYYNHYIGQMIDWWDIDMQRKHKDRIVKYLDVVEKKYKELDEILEEAKEHAENL